MFLTIISIIGIALGLAILGALIYLICLIKNAVFVLDENETPQKAPENAAFENEGIDGETVAAITAAVNCYYQEGKNAPRAGFIVRSIRKRI